MFIHQPLRLSTSVSGHVAPNPGDDTTLCLKKVPTFKLSVTLSNLNRFSIFCTAGKRMKFSTKPIRTTRLTLGMLLHYLGKLKIQIFC